jgi:hypothetical protein
MSFWTRLFGSSPKPIPRASESMPLPSPQFPFPLLKIVGEQAPSEWRKHQELWRREGCSAVVLSPETIHALAPLLATDDPPVAKILAAAEALSAQGFFAERETENLQDEAAVEVGDWPAGPVSTTTFNAHCEIGNGRPLPFVFLAKIPTGKSWEIPAYLKFGGWNACPDPAQQAAVLRYWNERHGMEVYSISSDVMECAVARPPRTREEALALAREQFLFCGDIVFQGTETLALLAAGILDAEAWFFWWD